VRGVHEVPGHGYEERRVDVLSSDAWIVWLDLDLMESVKGMTVKQTTIRYPVRVVRQAIDPESNPWGMALDGYGSEGPRRLTDVELAESSATGTNTDKGSSR
jgi:integrating conjugative element protein (TIGR03746 family)